MQKPDRLGRYVVDSLLGAGGFATVWLATDPVIDSRVAIKVLAENWARDLDVRRRFIEEAKVLWRADSDHIIRVHHVDELPDGRPYFVMAVADRGTLRDRMNERLQSGERFTVAEAAGLGAAICDGVQVVHDLGSIHRDIKPSNVLIQSVPPHKRKSTPTPGLAPDERFVLADFGLAKDAASSALTMVAGSPGYVAPEQARGLEAITTRADLFPIGIIVYELATGTMPFERDTIAKAANPKEYGKLPDVRRTRREAPPAMHDVLSRVLHPDPDKRPSSAGELATSLRAVEDLARPAAPQPGTPNFAAPTPPRPSPALAAPQPGGVDWRIVGGAVALLFVFAAIGLGVLLTGRGGDDPVVTVTVAPTVDPGGTDDGSDGGDDGTITDTVQPVTTSESTPTTAPVDDTLPRSSTTAATVAPTTPPPPPPPTASTEPRDLPNIPIPNGATRQNFDDADTGDTKVYKVGLSIERADDFFDALTTEDDWFVASGQDLEGGRRQLNLQTNEGDSATVLLIPLASTITADSTRLEVTVPG